MFKLVHEVRGFFCSLEPILQATELVISSTVLLSLRLQIASEAGTLKLLVILCFFGALGISHSSKACMACLLFLHFATKSPKAAKYSSPIMAIGTCRVTSSVGAA